MSSAFASKPIKFWPKVTPSATFNSQITFSKTSLNIIGESESPCLVPVFTLTTSGAVFDILTLIIVFK